MVKGRGVAWAQVSEGGCVVPLAVLDDPSPVVQALPGLGSTAGRADCGPRLTPRARSRYRRAGPVGTFRIKDRDGAGGRLNIWVPRQTGALVPVGGAWVIVGQSNMKCCERWWTSASANDETVAGSSVRLVVAVREAG